MRKHDESIMKNHFLSRLKFIKEQGSSAFYQRRNQKFYLPVSKQFCAKISKSIYFKLIASYQTLSDFLLFSITLIFLKEGKKVSHFLFLTSDIRTSADF